MKIFFCKVDINYNECYNKSVIDFCIFLQKAFDKNKLKEGK